MIDTSTIILSTDAIKQHNLLCHDSMPYNVKYSVRVCGVYVCVWGGRNIGNVGFLELGGLIYHRWYSLKFCYKTKWWQYAYFLFYNEFLFQL